MFHRLIKVGLPQLIALLFFVQCSDNTSPPDLGDPDLTVLYTNDEHGWMEQSSGSDGAAKLMGIWKDEEGYNDSSFLILSGGDNWTGPAISTWFKGESMVEVMNHMNYSAAAIGNHEFDFKVSGLYQRVEQANFPYLSANIRLKGTDIVPGFATPYVITDINDLKVGIIGLTTTSTPTTTFPTHVEDYDFISYSVALDEFVPQIWDAGAEIILCVAHICRREMVNLSGKAHTLGISMIGGGHCNELVSEIKHGDVGLIQGGDHLVNYARLDLWYDRENAQVTDIRTSIGANRNGTPDPDIETVVNVWQNATEAELGEIIGYTSATIPNPSTELHGLVTDSWLFAYPYAEIAITNIGGIRQSIAAGNISRGDIVGVLPFDNNILELQLTGSEVIDCLMSEEGGSMSYAVAFKHGNVSSLNMDSTYSVLTTDYLYVQTPLRFSTYDNQPYYTGLNYHQPTIDYILSLETSESNPLDDYLN